MGTLVDSMFGDTDRKDDSSVVDELPETGSKSETPADEVGSGAPADDNSQADPNAALMAQLAEMREELAFLKGKTDGKPAAEPEPQPAVTVAPESLFTADEIKRYQEDGDITVMTNGLMRGVQAGYTQILQKLPELIQQAVASQVSAQTTSTQVFDKHPELNTPGRKAILRHFVEDLAAKNPRMTAPELMQKAIGLTYKELNLPEDGAKPKPAPNLSGAGGRKGGGAPAGAKPKPQMLSGDDLRAKQIADMFD